MRIHRRAFLKYGGLGLLSLPLLGRFGTTIASAEDALPLVKETEKQAQALKFCENADKPSKACPQRKEPARQEQYCHNCQLFTKLSGEGKKAEGKCLLMPKNKVMGKSWCASWIKKAGT